MQSKVDIPCKKQSKVDIPGRKTSKAFILPVANIRLTFITGLILMALASGTSNPPEPLISENLMTKMEAHMELLEGLTESLATFAGYIRVRIDRIENMTRRLNGLNGGAANMDKEMAGQEDKLNGGAANADKDLTTRVGKLENLITNMDQMLKEHVKAMAQDVKTLKEQPGICFPPWLTHGTHCYMYVDKKKTWNEAEEYCLALGGHLASVHSQATVKFLKGFAKEGSIWLGGFKSYYHWQWIDGSTFDITYYWDKTSKRAQWGILEPNNAKYQEYCMHMWPTGYINDVPCALKFYIVCQK
uniref:hepatic lectin-like n=1 Tax=Doryrhamphus excisus TaxID=161450 RepID=UPI0025ADDB98|nr:hepatic lectin-like [Doryrhamphus excisus]